ncbi:MAG: hypothetical protein HFF48_06205, partial [Lawsonibacter sp.]|nr:hypothetical protein [Lawsonibacter sp.]
SHCPFVNSYLFIPLFSHLPSICAIFIFQTSPSIGLISHEKLIGSGKWQSRTVGKILADQVYTGDMVQGKNRSVRRKQSPTPPGNWIVVQDTHEPLVSRELFERALAARSRTAAKYAQNEKSSVQLQYFSRTHFLRSLW